MADNFSEYAGGIDAPAKNAFSITPDDSTDLTTSTRGIYVGVGGDVAAILQGDSASVIFVGVPTGTMLPVRVKRVLATGTTATTMVGVY